MLNESKAVSLIKGWAEDNDVLLSHNATVGRVGILKSTEPVLLGTSVTFYRFNTNYIEPRFMKICFMSEFFQGQLRAMMEQTTRNQVPITAQVSLNALIPPHAEQLEIVRRVEQLFAYADQLEAKVAAAQQRINALTQSLLAKAFRGELVPQDPGDEPASVLLERIRAQRAAAPKPKRGRKATTS
ncbi:Type I restriction enzyme StySPI specificity protein [Xanthomonas arboricola pv. fragariae]|nr:Type I restriction enzyme StySPI specificity protein [Xanthomonas arboricola pv. fragariae]